MLYHLAGRRRLRLLRHRGGPAPPGLPAGRGLGGVHPDDRLRADEDHRAELPLPEQRLPENGGWGSADLTHD